MCVFVSSYSLGWCVGHIFSPTYDKEDGVRFVAANHVVESKGPDTVLSVATESDDPSTITRYVYRLSTNAVEVLPLPLDPAPTAQLPHRNTLRENERLLALALVSGSPALAPTVMGQFANAAKNLTAPDRILMYVVGTAIAASGGALGFFVGYSDNRNYRAPEFQAGLRDPKSWHSFALATSYCYDAKLNLEAVGATDVQLPACRRLLNWENQNRGIGTAQLLQASAR